MKFCFFTDVHYTNRTPIYRKDCFPETVLKKVKEVARMCCKEDMIPICGGDLFDTPGVSNSTIGEIARVLREFKIPPYIVAGNHDLYGNNSATLDKTGLGVLLSAGLLQNLADGPARWYSANLNKRTIYLYGIESRIGLDETPENYMLREASRNPESHINIMVVHGMLKPQASSIFESVGVDQIANTNADIILSGHDHAGFRVTKANGRVFANPGALSRVSTSITDVNSTVKVAIIEIDEGTDQWIEVKYRPLSETVARPVEEVLDLELAHFDKRSREQAKLILNKINSIASIEPGMTEEEMIKKFIKELDLKEDTVTNIRRLLREAEEQIENN